MINNALLQPKSIAIIGASNSLEKPGGGLVHNLLNGGFQGEVFPVNPKEQEIQGLKTYNKTEDLPLCDMALLAIPAAFCVEAVEYLSKHKQTKAFIIISAGFSEMGEEGEKLEIRLKELAEERNLAIIGPNCIGVLNNHYKAVFVSPPPPVTEKGVDFVSASGALAVFLFETAAKHGLRFSNIFTVGNSTVIGVEEVLKHWDENYQSEKSSNVKMVYVEQIRKPELFFKHIHSLREKGCQVIVAKPGESEAGARAALSHTGALAGDSEAFNMLIEKAGAIRCYSREELVNIACILTQKPLKGNRLAIITHAGGPAVMLTDRLQKAGIEVPELDDASKKKILEMLYPGSSAINPIDMLATANRNQLRAVIKHCEELDYIDGSVVIYGKTGMEDLDKTYGVLSETIDEVSKPVFPVMPSINSANNEIQNYTNKAKSVFFDEVTFAGALDKVLHAPKVYQNELFIPVGNGSKETESKALKEEETFECLRWAGIPLVNTEFVYCQADLDQLPEMNYPVVAKVLGILHKTEVNGVVLNIENRDALEQAFECLAAIPGSNGILVQEMVKGTELYLGAKMHEGIGYSVHAGVGGIFIELIRDVAARLAPIEEEEARDMLQGLKSQKIFTGFRNMPPADANGFAQIIKAFSNIFRKYPEIREIDLNPLIANGENILAVDARIII
jgi:acetyltransferase